jgi:hypothetical protein
MPQDPGQQPGKRSPPGCRQRREQLFLHAVQDLVELLQPG